MADLQIIHGKASPAPPETLAALKELNEAARNLNEHHPDFIAALNHASSAIAAAESPAPVTSAEPMATVRWFAALPVYILFSLLMGLTVLLNLAIELCAMVLDWLEWQWRGAMGKPESGRSWQ